jgi:hypothetical protein
LAPWSEHNDVDNYAWLKEVVEAIYAVDVLDELNPIKRLECVLNELRVKVANVWPILVGWHAAFEWSKPPDVNVSRDCGDSTDNMSRTKVRNLDAEKTREARPSHIDITFASESRMDSGHFESVGPTDYTLDSVALQWHYQPILSEVRCLGGNSTQFQVVPLRGRQST